MSKLILKEGANPNYLASIGKIGETFPIEGADRLVRTVLNGHDIVISKDMKEGTTVVYFPCETVINEKFLSANNLFERGEFERNSNAKEVKELIVKAVKVDNDEERKEYLEKIKGSCGFFNKKGRVRIVKLRGVYSEGFIAGVDSLIKAYPELEGFDFESVVGTQFNYIGDEEFCWKYVPPVKEAPMKGNQSIWKKRMKKLKRFDRLIEGTFHFHYDTTRIEERMNELSPDDIVTITVKIHGSSGIFANIPVKRKLSRWDKIKKFFGAKISEIEYGNVYSSRRVIMSQNVNSDVTSGFYNKNIWECVNRDISQFIDKDMTVYGEICGYIEDSQNMIQPKHDYGCKEGCWKFMPYRISVRQEDGTDKEWNVVDVNAWTYELIANHPELKDKIMPMTLLYHGRFGSLYSDIPEDENWHKNILERMKNDKVNFKMELNEPLCKNKVPREGIVIRIDNDEMPRAWKLKTKAHFAKECEAHDNGESDIEEES